MTLDDLINALGPFVPPTIGAFVGLKYAKAQTRLDQAISWAGSAAAGIYLGAAAGESWHLGRATTIGAGFLIAMFGSELFAVVVATLRQLAADPVATFRRWRGVILGGGER